MSSLNLVAPLRAKKTSGASRFAIHSTTRRPVPDVPFSKIARTILGKDYSLSLVLVGDAKARALNRTYRNKHTPANVLSFPLSMYEGEIFINLARARREAHRFGLSEKGHVLHLFIHGCVHLKGHDHGSTMDRIEHMLWRRFSVR